MNADTLFSKLAPFCKRNVLVLCLILVSLIFFSYGLIQLISSQHHANDMTFQAGVTASVGAVAGTATQSAGIQTKTVLVDVSGAVVNPGVYHLDEGSRIKDALIAAGGVSDQANKEVVAKNINLAAKVTDAMKIYIPFRSETSVAVQSASSFVQTDAGGGKATPNGQININTASATELDSLPGVGSVTAGKIITNRPYTTIEELVSKKSVTQKIFEKIKSSIIAN